MLSCALGMSHICWYKGHDKSVLPVPDWKAHKAQQATRWETGLRQPSSERCRSAVQQSNVGMTPARSSLRLAFCEPASPPLLVPKQHKKVQTKRVGPVVTSGVVFCLAIHMVTELKLQYADHYVNVSNMRGAFHPDKSTTTYSIVTHHLQKSIFKRFLWFSGN